MGYDYKLIKSKLLSGTASQEEIKAFTEYTDSLEDKNKKLVDKSSSINGNTVQDLYKYINESCNVEYKFEVMFNFFKFLIDKAKDQIPNFETDSDSFYDIWGHLPLEDVVKCLSALGRKGATALPSMKEIDPFDSKGNLKKSSSVNLPNGENGLISEYIVTSLIDHFDKKQKQNLEKLEKDLTESLSSGEIDHSEFLNKKLKLEKVKKGEVVIDDI